MSRIFSKKIDLSSEEIMEPYDDYDFDLESLLKDHEKKGEEYRAKKKQKAAGGAYKSDEDEKYADAFTGYEIPFDTLPSLCIERIFSMVSFIESGYQY